MNRTDFASAVGIGRTTAWRWENSDQRPENIRVVAQVAEVLGVDLDEALEAAGLRPAERPPERPTDQQPPLDPRVRMLLAEKAEARRAAREAAEAAEAEA